MKSKNKILTIFSILCLVIGILELLFGGLIITLGINSDMLETEIGTEEIMNIPELKDVPIQYIVIFFGVINLIEGLFFLFEAFLIRRASKNGKKTLFLIILLLIGIASQLITLIGAASANRYDVSSAIDVVSLIIKETILKQVFEVRRLDMDD